MAPRRMHTCSSDDPRRQELRGDERELKATGLAAPRGCVRHLSVQAYLLNLLSSDWVLSLVTWNVVRWSASPCARGAAASRAAARPTRSHVGLACPSLAAVGRVARSSVVEEAVVVVRSSVVEAAAVVVRSSAVEEAVVAKAVAKARAKVKAEAVKAKVKAVDLPLAALPLVAVAAAALAAVRQEARRSVVRRRQAAAACSGQRPPLRQRGAATNGEVLRQRPFLRRQRAGAACSRQRLLQRRQRAGSRARGGHHSRSRWTMTRRRPAAPPSLHTTPSL